MLKEFLKKYRMLGYDWDIDISKYHDKDNGRNLAEIYTPYIIPGSAERIIIYIEEVDGKLLASTEALSDSMFELLGEDDWLTNKYLNQIKNDLLKLDTYNQLEECLNTVVYRFDLDKFNYYRLSDMCNYCITIITMIMNYKKYNWGI